MSQFKKKINNLVEKWAKDVWIVLSWEETIMVNKYIKRYSVLIIIREMIMRKYFIPIYLAKLRNLIVSSIGRLQINKIS